MSSFDSNNSNQINIVFDFDNIINDEFEAHVRTFDYFIKKENKLLDPMELSLRLLYLDTNFGDFDFNQIINIVMNEYNLNFDITQFEMRYENELKIRDDIIKLFHYFNTLKENYLIKVIIWSFNETQSIKQFLKKFNIKVDSIYGKQRKYLKSYFDDLVSKENLISKNTIFVGDKLIDVFLPKILGFNVVLWHPVLSKKKLYDAIIEKISILL